jgi:NAD(P)-dependent dehydrogenase (short-subunit alcohol dehydrogenase family)
VNTFSSDALKGKTAVVTGAARGLGRAAAVALAQAGSDIIGIDIAGTVSPILEVVPATIDELEETAESVRNSGRRWLAIRLDQRDINALRRTVEQIKKEFGGLDIVFANAGIQSFKPLLEMEDADWHDQIDVNLNGTANVLRVFAPLLVERGAGRIIVTSSTQGRHGTKFGACRARTRKIQNHGQRRRSRVD